MYLFEGSKNYTIKFEFKGKEKTFNGSSLSKTVGPIIDFLYNSGYKFVGDIHQSFSRKLVTLAEIQSSDTWVGRFKRGVFYRLKNSSGLPIDKYIAIGTNINPTLDFVTKCLINFGIDPSTIKTEGFDTNPSKIKKFQSFSEPEESEEEDEIQSDPESNYQENPFKQAICVLGKSGRGKSTTIDKILNHLDHKYQFIIPTASTTALLSQYSPKSGYIKSRLGKMIVDACANPNTLFTAVFDECHKANVIEMINDELLQAISIHRNEGKRFISVDDETADLYEGVDKDNRGNLLIPDNMGFIFLSSKPDIITRNIDFFNRVDIYVMIEQPKDVTIDDVITLYEDDTFEFNDDYFVKVDGKSKDDIDKIKELNDNE